MKSPHRILPHWHKSGILDKVFERLRYEHLLRVRLETDKFSWKTTATFLTRRTSPLDAHHDGKALKELL